MLVITTVPDINLGKNIAKKLVAEHLAACINIVGEVSSIYTWQEKICDEKEYVLLIKTDDFVVNKVFQRIRELHSYEVPELIALRINNIGKEYWDWLEEWIGKQ